MSRRPTPLSRIRPGRLAVALLLIGLLVAAASPALGAARGAARAVLVVVAVAVAVSWMLDLLRRRRSR